MTMTTKKTKQNRPGRNEEGLRDLTKAKNHAMARET
jgi:hypothetical protein